MAPEMVGCTEKPDEMKHMHFLNKDEQWLTKCNKIWDKVRNNIKQNLIVILSKIKKSRNKIYYESNINTKLYNNGMSKEDSHCICLSVILIFSAFKIGKSCYPQGILRE